MIQMNSESRKPLGLQFQCYQEIKSLWNYNSNELRKLHKIKWLNKIFGRIMVFLLFL